MRVNYVGTSAVEFEGRVFEWGENARGGVMPKFAREMIEKGMDPETRVSVYRNGTPCFLDVPLGRWAGLTVIERDVGGVAFEKWSPRSV